jgi:hypothetical protein
MYITPTEYLEIIRKEYLQEFIRQGGTAVKFIVPTEEIDHKELQQQLCSVSEAEGYLFSTIDAAKTGVHMIDHIFHAVARQIEWDDLVFSFVSSILSNNGFTVPSRQEFNIRKLSELNQLDETQLPVEIQKLLIKHLFHDYQMCQEFRIAMMRLCLAQLDPSDVYPVPSHVIKAWLRGELRLVSEIKPAHIFQKISRHNARHMLSSLSHWLHLTGKSGLFITLDISRCLVQRPKPKDLYDDSRYYTNASILDVYEVLRQFIDTTDDMEFCFIAVIATPPFLHVDNIHRGIESYPALKWRIWDDVRDKNRVNPFSSLIRLSPCPTISGEPHKEIA